MKKEFSIQLYSVRDKTEEDFIGTLEKLARMGYTGVEFAGFGGIPAAEMKRQLERLGLASIGAHTGAELLSGDALKEQIEYNLTIGSRYIICPWYDLKDSESLLRLSELLNGAGEICRENGLVMAYHNHGHEFGTLKGIYLLDQLLAHTEPALVKLELDVFWAEHAGVDAVSYFKRRAPRCELLHLKQIGDGKKNVDLPDGTISMPRLIEAARSLGVRCFVVEQEEYGIDSLTSAAVNAAYLESVL